MPGMSRYIALGLLLLVASSALGGKRAAEPTFPSEFEIGRHTFFDFGPPNDYYEVFIVLPATSGTAITRLTFTPGTKCVQPATVENASGFITQSVPELLERTNPCVIPEKELHRERKRCKKCLVFSGANISMRVMCRGQTRIIRSDILDRDMFDPAPNTPEHTSWTMRLMAQLDKAVGPGVMEKPISPIPSAAEVSAPVSHLPDSINPGAGGFDELFAGAPDKPSEIYKASQQPTPQPTARLLSSSPVAPHEFIAPAYPPIAKLANVSSQVSVSMTIDENGNATDIHYKTENLPFFRGVSEEAIRKWRFSKDASGQTVDVVLDFNTNCRRD